MVLLDLGDGLLPNQPQAITRTNHFYTHDKMQSYHGMAWFVRPSIQQNIALYYSNHFLH